MSTPESGFTESVSKHFEMQLFRADDVVRLTGLSRATINRLVQGGQFPKAIRITQRISAWKKRDLVDWLESRPEA